jgi:hypothetical protein
MVATDEMELEEAMGVMEDFMVATEEMGAMGVMEEAHQSLPLLDRLMNLNTKYSKTPVDRS